VEYRSKGKHDIFSDHDAQEVRAIAQCLLTVGDPEGDRRRDLAIDEYVAVRRIASLDNIKKLRAMASLSPQDANKLIAQSKNFFKQKSNDDGTLGNGDSQKSMETMPEEGLEWRSQSPYKNGHHPWLNMIKVTLVVLEEEVKLWRRLLPLDMESCVRAYEAIARPLIDKLKESAAMSLLHLVGEESQLKGIEGEASIVCLDLFMGIEKSYSKLEAALSPLNMTGTIMTKDLSFIRSMMCDGVGRALVTMIESVRENKKTVTPTATVHVVTSNCVRAIRRLLRCEDSFSIYVTRQLELDNDSQAPKHAGRRGNFQQAVGIEHSSFAFNRSDNLFHRLRMILSTANTVKQNNRNEKETRQACKLVLGPFVLALTEALVVYLQEVTFRNPYQTSTGPGAESMIARKCKEAPLHLFMCNNCLYLTQFFEALMEKEGNLVSAVDASALRIFDAVDASSDSDQQGATLEEQLAKLHNQAVERFVRCGWEDLLSHCALVEESQLKKVTGKSHLTLESGRLLKKKFESFSEDFDELISTERKLAVPDITLRNRLRDRISDALLQPYTDFFNKYSKVQFSKKNMEKYLDHPPGYVEDALSEILQGLT